MLTKIHIVKAMIFPVVMYVCESWTIKKVECWRIDAFELWCWRRLLDCTEIKPVNPKGNQSWTFIGRTDAKVEAPILWPPDEKSWLIRKDPDTGKDWRQEEKGMTEDEMVGWYHWLNGHMNLSKLRELVMWLFGHKESDTTERLNWIDLHSFHNLLVFSEDQWYWFSFLPQDFLPTWQWNIHPYFSLISLQAPLQGPVLAHLLPAPSVCHFLASQFRLLLTLDVILGKVHTSLRIWIAPINWHKSASLVQFLSIDIISASLISFSLSSIPVSPLSDGSPPTVFSNLTLIPLPTLPSHCSSYRLSHKQ